MTEGGQGGLKLYSTHHQFKVHNVTHSSTGEHTTVDLLFPRSVERRPSRTKHAEGDKCAESKCKRDNELCREILCACFAYILALALVKYRKGVNRRVSSPGSLVDPFPGV